MLGMYIATTDRSYLIGGYARGEENGSSFVIMILLQAVFIAMVTLYGLEIKNHKKLQWSKLKYPAILLVLYIVVIVATGRRSSAIRIASLLVMAYIYIAGRSVNYKKVVTIIVASVIIFSLVGIMRGDTNTLKEGFRMLNTQETIMPVTRELANSVNTLHVAVSNVPVKIDYNYGSTFFQAFCALVPGLDRFYRAYLADGPVMNSSEYITYLYFGEDPLYGLGSSIVADVYISFGPIGVLLIFIMLGAFIRYLELNTFAKDSSPYILALSFCCYSQYMAVCRGAMSSMFLSLSYSWILIFLFTKRMQQR
jgi:oligosaccharide repeat unit polymerase